MGIENNPPLKLTKKDKFTISSVLATFEKLNGQKYRDTEISKIMGNLTDEESDTLSVLMEQKRQLQTEQVKADIQSNTLASKEMQESEDRENLLYKMLINSVQATKFDARIHATNLKYLDAIRKEHDFRLRMLTTTGLIVPTPKEPKEQPTDHTSNLGTIVSERISNAKVLITEQDNTSVKDVVPLAEGISLVRSLSNMPVSTFSMEDEPI